MGATAASSGVSSESIQAVAALLAGVDSVSLVANVTVWDSNGVSSNSTKSSNLLVVHTSASATVSIANSSAIVGDTVQVRVDELLNGAPEWFILALYFVDAGGATFPITNASVQWNGGSGPVYAMNYELHSGFSLRQESGGVAGGTLRAQTLSEMGSKPRADTTLHLEVYVEDSAGILTGPFRSTEGMVVSSVTSQVNVPPGILCNKAARTLCD